jgi:hypothetical protein
MAFGITQFRSEMNAHAFVKTNKYIVNFNKIPDSITSPPSNASSEYKTMVAEFLAEFDKKTLSFRSDSLNWPGVGFATMDTPPRAGYGATELIPYAPIFDEVTINFVIDEYTNVHKFFWLWTNSIIDLKSQGQSKLKEGAFTLGYKDNYCADIEITMYNELGTGDEHKLMTATLYRAFPRSMPPFNLAWAEDEVVRISIPFSYTDFDVKHHPHPKKKPAPPAAPPATTLV